MRTNTMFTNQSILGKLPSSSYKPKLYSVTPFPKSSLLSKVDKTNALSKPVTSNSTPSTRESKVVQTVNVIAPRIFRTNPFKTFRVDNVVPNKPVKISVRIKPITVSQPNVIHKQQAESNSKTRWILTGRIFAMCGKLTASSNTKNKSEKSVCDNASTSNPSEPSSKGFLNSTSLLGRNDNVAAILGFGDLQRGNILITRVYFVEGLGQNLFLVGQFCDLDLEVAFRRNTCFVRNLERVDLLKGNCDNRVVLKFQVLSGKFSRV
ncbi:hypothetical protein Tco_0706476 [Tanacetum coccineum]|uniref:Integrase, catalytic region, zinc finger, CCHC-type, peptidase aspartic, catalytic n=1 Tax=Tanacetum coccineum TaxID=301880 RepID=A0ABQ4Y7M9_9ASTR